MRVVDEVNYKAGTMNSKIKNISLRPKTYDSVTTVGTYSTGKPITMYESVLNNSSLLVNSYLFESKFTYKYEACIRSSCSNKTDVVVGDVAKKKVLLVINGSLNIDKNSTFATNLKTNLSFFDAFVRLRYDDKISPITNRTPSSYTEGFVLEVDENAKSAKKLDLVINIRDKQYIVNLK